ncbi:hypothetical protein Droror1_Dr00014514 [Drosera rotundifolia]
MLETIRRKFMERIAVKRSRMEKYESKITPHIWKRIEKTKKLARNCFSIFAGNNLWEVEEYGSQYVVDVTERSCTCGMWDISGISCKHAISCLEMDRAQLQFFVHPYYQKKAYLDTYSFTIHLMSSQPNWISSNLPRLEPPIIRVPIGRPRKERRRARDEPRKDQNTSRMSRTGVQMTYQKCFKTGHNARGCKNPIDLRSKNNLQIDNAAESNQHQPSQVINAYQIQGSHM